MTDPIYLAAALEAADQHLAEIVKTGEISLPEIDAFRVGFVEGWAGRGAVDFAAWLAASTVRPRSS